MLQVARLAPRLLGDASELVTGFVRSQLTTQGIEESTARDARDAVDAHAAPEASGVSPDEPSQQRADRATGFADRATGFADRASQADLYYTVFGIECLLALHDANPQGLPVDALRRYALSQGTFLDAPDDYRQLDFIHVCCLTHVWHALSHWAEREGNAVETGGSGSLAAMPVADRAATLRRIAQHRTADGGFNVTPPENGSDGMTPAPTGSAYGCFMAYSAHQNLEADVDDLPGLVRCLRSLEHASGGFANDMTPEVTPEVSTDVTPERAPGVTDGAPQRAAKPPRPMVPTVPATAAAITLLKQLDEPVDPRHADWLIQQCHPEGGFFATPGAPLPDLLSTATALHALAAMGRDVEPIKEPCLDYIDSLWTNRGSFHGHWSDEDLDVEYTFYGLLALGHLSV